MADHTDGDETKEGKVQHVENVVGNMPHANSNADLGSASIVPSQPAGEHASEGKAATADDRVALAAEVQPGGSPPAQGEGQIDSEHVVPSTEQERAGMAAEDHRTIEQAAEAARLEEARVAREAYAAETRRQAEIKRKTREAELAALRAEQARLARIRAAEIARTAAVRKAEREVRRLQKQRRREAIQNRCSGRRCMDMNLPSRLCSRSCCLQVCSKGET